MTRDELLDLLEGVPACVEAQEWVLEHSARTAEGCWNDCPDGGWVLWLAVLSGALSTRAAGALLLGFALPLLPDLTDDGPQVTWWEQYTAWTQGSAAPVAPTIDPNDYRGTLRTSAYFILEADCLCQPSSLIASGGANAANDAATMLLEDHDEDDTEEQLAVLAALVRGKMPWAAVEAGLKQVSA